MSEGRTIIAGKIVIYTTPWCGDCKAAKRFLGERGIAYEDVDIERHPEAAGIVMRFNNGMRKKTLRPPDSSSNLFRRDGQAADAPTRTILNTAGFMVVYSALWVKCPLPSARSSYGI